MIIRTAYVVWPDRTNQNAPPLSWDFRNRPPWPKFPSFVLEGVFHVPNRGVELFSVPNSHFRWDRTGGSKCQDSPLSDRTGSGQPPCLPPCPAGQGGCPTCPAALSAGHAPCPLPVRPPCPAFFSTSGCDWRHMDAYSGRQQLSVPPVTPGIACLDMPRCPMGRAVPSCRLLPPLRQGGGRLLNGVAIGDACSHLSPPKPPR